MRQQDLADRIVERLCEQWRIQDVHFAAEIIREAFEPRGLAVVELVEAAKQVLRMLDNESHTYFISEHRLREALKPFFESAAKAQGE